MGKVRVKKFCKDPQKNVQGKEGFKSQKHKTKLSSKSKDRKWVDGKIEELDVSLAELREAINFKKGSNNTDTGKTICTDNIQSNKLTSKPFNNRSMSEPSSSTITENKTDNSVPGIDQSNMKEELLAPVVGGWMGRKEEFLKKVHSTHNQKNSGGIMTGCCQSRKSSNHRIQTAGIIIIGDEILKGQVMDVNSHFICKQLHDFGVKVPRISVIGDDIEEIGKEVKKFSSRFNYVFTTGGVGPTHDDITYLGIANAFGERVLLHPEMNTMVDKWLSNRGYEPDVIRKMAELPASAKLLFDPNRPPLSSFPIVNVRNVYIFPGIPQFLERMFPRMLNVLREEFSGNDDRTKFHCEEILVDKDELSITPQINKAVEKFKDTVIFGSYPVVDNVYFKTRLTMESLSFDCVQESNDYMKGLLPENSVVESYDKDPVSTAAVKVYAIASNEEHELQKVVSQSLKVVEEAFEKYGMEGLCVCFNGGKDCTALLHLVHAVAQKMKLGTNIPFQGLYIKGDNPFPEMETFIEETSAKYELKMFSYNGPIKNGLTAALQEHPGLKGVFMGTRRSDPSGQSLNYAQMTDAGWPQVMRISPLLDWTFSDIWSFLRTLTLPYCPLYDRGYTSIGNRSNTLPNPALAIETKDGEPKYRPAYTLNDPHAERTGRQ